MVFLILAFVVIILFILLIVVAIMYWYITIPILIVGYVLYKYSNGKKSKSKETSSATERTYYDPNYSSTDYSSNYSSRSEESSTNQNYNYRREYYNKKSSGRSRQSSYSRESRIQKRLAEFDITESEAEIIFGRAWRSKLAMYDWRLYFVIKDLEIKITYDINGRYKRKFGHLYNKVQEIIRIVIEANPDLEGRYEKSSADYETQDSTYDDYQSNYENTNDYQSNNESNDDSSQYNSESLQDDVVAAFQVLGLKTSATQEEIKKRYKELILKFHPDRNKSPNATAKTKEIIAAHDLIMQVKAEAR